MPTGNRGGQTKHDKHKLWELPASLPAQDSPLFTLRGQTHHRVHLV